jgi:thiamine pyrophosphate-dependent acetolactate synthase large subunit-like protein
MHAAGQGADGFRVVDVWESEEAAQAFGEQLGPVLADVGVTDAPELYPAHTFVSS